MKKVDLTRLDVAIKYVERIADGRNPVNNVPLENNDILNNPNIIRCMYFIKDVLEAVQDNGGVIGGRSGKEPSLPFPMEILDQFSYVEDKSITHVLNQIYEPIAEMNIKKVSVTITMEIIQSQYIAADATLTNVATAWATAKV